MCLDLNRNTVIKKVKSSKLAFLHNAGFNKKVQFDLSTFTESLQFILQSIKGEKSVLN